MRHKKFMMHFQFKEDTHMKQFIIWYKFDGEEDYTIITGANEDEATRKFRGWYSGYIIDIHEIEDSEAHLAYC